MKAIGEIRGRPNRATRGERTRQEILDAAVHIASAEGLEGLTIGRLAQELHMSKSGLFAHFGSKEELQLAVIGNARDIFVREVVNPASGLERGLIRLLGMLDQWLAYVGGRVFSGGCFFMAAAIEFDSRPGQVRDLIAGLSRSWLDTIEAEVEHAQSLGQLQPALDASQLAFELHALVQEANWYYKLFDDKRAFDRARIAIIERLRMAATQSGLRFLARRTGARKRMKIRKTKGLNAK
jgi:AcrR family transcriptional regulator